MATNKFATIRYQALDRCFSNFGRNYDINGLVEKCNEAIYEYSGIEDGVKKRQVYEDIKFMQSEQGWSVPLEITKNGKRAFYRYTTKGFSISQKPLNEDEVNQLKETISILDRFKGIEQFAWMEDIKIKMETAYKVKTEDLPIVSFEQNPYLRGLEHFSKLFSAIQYKTVIKVKYQGYKQSEPVEMIIHPYHLKQYNSRWFLFGLNNERNEISNLALDRILNFEESPIQFIPSEIDFLEYFDDVIGVTIRGEIPTEKILLQIDNNRWAYIESKPIHGSQKVKEKNDMGVTIQLELQINNELINILLGFGADITVLEPEHLKLTIKNKVKLMNEKYF
ncbi:helix-turn-helix transcriptional regulator [Aquirufa sp. ROCK2-A2]